MEPEENPYASPTAAFELILEGAPRKIGFAFNAIVGFITGALLFVAALFLTPTESPSVSQFDQQLSQRVGILLPVAIGFWVAWIRQSQPWLFVGPVTGFFLGIAYWKLVTVDVVTAVFFLPVVLGAIASYFLGLRKNGESSSVRRLLLGASAVAILGFVYITALGIFDFIEGIDFRQSVEEYVIEKWKIGPSAFAIACGVFFPLFHWASSIGQSAGR